MIMLIKKNGLHYMVVAYPSLKKMNSAEQRWILLRILQWKEWKEHFISGRQTVEFYTIFPHSECEKLL